MARFRYQHIKSSVEGKAPTAAQIKVAEIGVNDFAGDEKLFIKNSENEVVDFPRGYSREYIDEIDYVLTTAVNDLNSRKLDASAYTPTDLTNYYTKSETSGATEIQDALDDKQNVLVSGTNIKTINNESILGEGNITISGGSGTVDQVLDETTSASTNAIATQAVYGPIADLSGQSETVAAALVELNSEHETIAAALVDLNSEHETIATALVDLDERIIELSGRTPIVAVDEVIDNTTSGSSNPVATKAVYDALIENEEIVSAALSDLEDNKLEISAFTAHTSDTVAHVTQAEKNSWATKSGDLDNIKLKKITQSDYDALVQAGTTDPNTLYIITD